MKFLEPKNARSPILVTLSGITVEQHPTTNLFSALSIMALQSFRLSYVLLRGSTDISVSLPHLLKAPSPILVTPAGIMTLVRFSHPSNASSFMLTTLSGITAELHPAIILFSEISMIQLQFSRLSNVLLKGSTDSLTRLSQYEKAFFPILVTPAGINMFVKVSQQEKASSPMLLTLSGIVMAVRLRQP